MRVPRALLIAALLASACARTLAPAADSDTGSPSPDPPSSEGPTFPSRALSDAPVVTGYEGSAPPIWSLSFDETEPLVWWIFGLFGPEPEGTPTECVEQVPDRDYVLSERSQACMERIFSAHGVSEAAVDLLWRSHLMVFAVAGTGPVWVGDLVDWDYYDTNGANADAIVIPGGILEVGSQDGWRPWAEASEAALTSKLFGEIEEALWPDITTPWGEPGPPLRFGQYGGEDTELSLPVATPDGWSVPVTMRLAGCHACISEFAGRFSFDFSATGDPTGVRFLGWCTYSTHSSNPWTNQDQVAAIMARLAPCDSRPAFG